jgi:N-acetylneuraminate epimerase
LHFALTRRAVLLIPALHSQPNPVRGERLPNMIFFRHRTLRRGWLLALAPVMGFATAAMEPLALKWNQLPSVPDAEGFASAFAGVSHGALLVAGGANFPGKRPWEGGAKVWYDEVFVLESPEGPWRTGGRLPRANAYGVSFTTADGVVCAGGGDAREHWRDVFLLTWDGAQVRTKALPALPTPLAFGSGAAIGSKIYLFGGLVRPDATTASANFWILDLSLASPAWRELPPCPGPARMLAQVGVVDGVFYVCGGVSLHAGPDDKAVRTYLSDTYAYEPAKSWRKLADMPHAVAAAPSPMPVSPAGELLVISGDDGTRGHLVGPDHPGFKQEVLVYDSVRDTWKQSADAPISRATAPTALWQGAWIVASGERKPGYRSPEIWAVQIAP